MSPQLADRVAIVTGGARGIGLGIAQALRAEGARIALVDLDEAAVRDAGALLDGDTLALGADASEEVAMQGAVAQVIERFGALDILVNNAGGGRPGTGLGNPFTRLSQSDWDHLQETNLRTAFASSKAAIPHLVARGGGSIVNVASVAGQVPTPTMPAYGAAKAGMLYLTRSLALELASKQIRVNAICPGLVWTRAWETLATMLKHAVPAFADKTPREIFLDRVRRSVPMGREQTIEDIAELALFLVSDRARAITGQEISVDGGLTQMSGS